ncbi:MAG: glycoside hydrolase family 65 protein [Abditibacteriota bacterium]|nr:glycoside hydrolase family 65 protein [Abditibacteriota bacterium]
MWRVSISIVAAALLCICLAAGCSRTGRPAGDGDGLWKNTAAKEQQDPWLLVSDRLPEGEEAGTYLANGFYGVRLYSTGFGRKQDGSPAESRCYACYTRNDGSEKIQNLPQTADLRFYDEKGEELRQTGKGFRQTLDMKNACLITEGEWKSSNMKAEIRSAVYVPRTEPARAMCAIELEITPSSDGTLTIKAPVGKGDVDLPTAQWTNAPFEAGDEFSCSLQLVKKRTEKACYSALIRVPGSDGGDPFGSVPEIIDSHKAAWARLWERDIVIEGDPEAQQAVHSNMFYLLQSCGKDFGIPPTGLSSDAFGGHVFWDTELWMVPALIWQYPEYVREVLRYRINTLPAALALGQKYTGRPGCAAFAWESAASGSEVTPGDVPTRDERHITSDIVFAMWQYYKATGDKAFLAECYETIRTSANFWAAFARKGGDGKYHIERVCPPDENAGLVDDSAYTNATAQAVLYIAGMASELVGKPAPAEWKQVAEGLELLSDGSKLTIYRDYEGGIIKQADPELLWYPWKYQDLKDAFAGAALFDKQAEATCDFYMGKTEKNGPAMASSVHSVIVARLKGDAAGALELFRNSYRPYMRGPFNYFNEKKSATYKTWCFLTGAANSASAVLWGFAGLDMDYYTPEIRHTVKPCVPEEWKSVTLKGVRFNGKICDITARPDGTYEVK